MAGDAWKSPDRVGAPRAPAGAGGDDRNTLAGVIEDVAFLGAVVRVRLARDAVIVDTFNSGAGDLPARGESVAINFGRDDLIVLEPA